MKPFYAYNTYNPQKENILFLHGFLECSGAWSPYVIELAKYFNCFLYDFPGHGENINFPINNISFENIAKDIISELRELNIQNTHIICHSMGGYFGGYLKFKYPMLFNKIVLSNSLLNSDTEEQLKKRVKTIRVIQTNLNLLCKISFNQHDTLNKKNKEKQCRNCSKEHLIKLQYILSHRTNLTFLLDEYPSDISFIFGENDTHIPWQDFNNKIKNRQHILLNEGHTLPINSKTQWLNIILELLK